MKTIFDHLLACIGEECGEVNQVVGKAQRFGILDTNPKTKNSNWVELRKEVHDVIAVYEMLCDAFDRVETLDRNLIECKKKRVEKYMEYARDRGQLNSYEEKLALRIQVQHKKISELRQENERLKAESKWISVEDEPPKEYEKVLVKTRSNEVGPNNHTDVFCGYFGNHTSGNRRWVVSSTGGYLDEHILGWQPLPTEHKDT